MSFQSITPILIVDNVNDAVAYYQELLGLTLTMTVPETGEYIWAMLQKEEFIIQLQAKAVIEMPEWRTGDGAMLYINMVGLHDFYTKISHQNVTVLMEPTKQFYGATEFSIKDKYQYVWIFAEDIE